MQVEFIHQMPGVGEAYEAAIKLDAEPAALVAATGIILLVYEDGSPDWYVFVAMNDPSSEDRNRVLAVMDKKGTRTDKQIDDLLLNPHLGGCFLGGATQIRADLQQLVNGEFVLDGQLCASPDGYSRPTYE
jgi:hypothetical protein